jgi:hypothetical protein
VPYLEAAKQRWQSTHSNAPHERTPCLQLALTHMKEGGCIINCASIQGYSPTPAVLDYATTKVQQMLTMPMNPIMSLVSTNLSIPPVSLWRRYGLSACQCAPCSQMAHSSSLRTSFVRSPIASGPCCAGSHRGHDEGHVDDAG